MATSIGLFKYGLESEHIVVQSFPYVVALSAYDDFRRATVDQVVKAYPLTFVVGEDFEVVAADEGVEESYGLSTVEALELLHRLPRR